MVLKTLRELEVGDVVLKMFVNNILQSNFSFIVLSKPIKDDFYSECLCFMLTTCYWEKSEIAKISFSDHDRFETQ
jgi:hypothetical protein